MTIAPIPLPCYPNGPGVYILSDDLGKILYVGSSRQLCRRVSYITALARDRTNPQGYTHGKAGLVREHQNSGRTVSVTFIECPNVRVVELDLIAKHNPLWNQS